jgi:putative hydrolase of the HAD superfamily
MNPDAEHSEVQTQPMKVVCFDFGGVLVRISRSWEEACEKAGIDPSQIQLPDMNMLIASGNAAEFQRGEIEFETFIDREARRLNSQITPAQLKRVHSRWLIDEVPELAALIRRLNQTGLITASLSNTDAEHWKTLREMESIKNLTILGLSFELGMLKPDVEIYQEAELLFDACGSSILFFDDLPANVQAASQCGWNAILIDPMKPAIDQIQRGLEAFGIII